MDNKQQNQNSRTTEKNNQYQIGNDGKLIILNK